MSRCALDTDVLIAALDLRDAHHGAAAKAFRTWGEAGEELIISSVNYAETVVRPAESSASMEIAVDAIDALGVRVVPATASIARDAAVLRSLGISLADGFALGTARAHEATVATFDRRVRRSLRRAGLQSAPALR